MMDHRSGGGFAVYLSRINLFQHLCVPDRIIHVRPENIKHIRPVLIIGSKVSGLQAFGKFRPVFIPMEVRLQEHEMKQKP